MKKFLVTFEVESGDEYTSPQLLAEVHSSLRYWFQSTSVKYTGLDVVQQDEADVAEEDREETLDTDTQAWFNNQRRENAEMKFYDELAWRQNPQNLRNQ